MPRGYESREIARGAGEGRKASRLTMSELPPPGFCARCAGESPARQPGATSAGAESAAGISGMTPPDCTARAGGVAAEWGRETLSKRVQIFEHVGGSGDGAAAPTLGRPPCRPDLPRARGSAAGRSAKPQRLRRNGKAGERARHGTALEAFVCVLTRRAEGFCAGSASPSPCSPAAPALPVAPRAARRCAPQRAATRRGAHPPGRPTASRCAFADRAPTRARATLRQGRFARGVRRSVDQR